jgi:hypothetical protein
MTRSQDIDFHAAISGWFAGNLRLMSGLTFSSMGPFSQTTPPARTYGPSSPEKADPQFSGK